MVKLRTYIMPLCRATVQGGDPPVFSSPRINATVAHDIVQEKYSEISVSVTSVLAYKFVFNMFYHIIYIL